MSAASVPDLVAVREDLRQLERDTQELRCVVEPTSKLRSIDSFRR